MADFRNGKIGYTLQIAVTPLFNPVDNTTYFFGGVSANNITEGVSRVYIPKSGIIKKCYVHFVNGVVGTAEASSISIRINNTTDTLISNAVNNSANFSPVNNTSLSIAVSEGDYVELKWVTPTWITNPTNMGITAILYIE